MEMESQWQHYDKQPEKKNQEAPVGAAAAKNRNHQKSRNKANENKKKLQ